MAITNSWVGKTIYIFENKNQYYYMYTALSVVYIFFLIYQRVRILRPVNLFKNPGKTANSD